MKDPGKELLNTLLDDLHRYLVHGYSRVFAAVLTMEIFVKKIPVRFTDVNAIYSYF